MNKVTYPNKNGKLRPLSYIGMDAAIRFYRNKARRAKALI